MYNDFNHRRQRSDSFMHVRSVFFFIFCSTQFMYYTVCNIHVSLLWGQKGKWRNCFPIQYYEINFSHKLLKIHRYLKICKILMNLLLKPSQNKKGQTIFQLHRFFNPFSRLPAVKKDSKNDAAYGNRGCGVFKGGIQNQKGFCLRIIIPKGNF